MLVNFSTDFTIGAFSRKDCEAVAKLLVQEGVAADVYHAGLTDKKRLEVQTKWMNNEIYVICATIGYYELFINASYSALIELVKSVLCFQNYSN